MFSFIGQTLMECLIYEQWYKYPTTNPKRDLEGEIKTYWYVNINPYWHRIPYAPQELWTVLLDCDHGNRETMEIADQIRDHSAYAWRTRKVQSLVFKETEDYLWLLTRGEKNEYTVAGGKVIDLEPRDPITDKVQSILDYLPGHWLWKHITKLFGLDLDAEVHHLLGGIEEYITSWVTMLTDGYLLFIALYLLIRPVFGDDGWLTMCVVASVASLIRDLDLYE
jgi:hypothetical protein